MKKPSTKQLLALMIALALVITGYQAVSKQMARNKMEQACKENGGSSCPTTPKEVDPGVSVIFDSITRNLLYIVF